jgi:hypothetical protein
MDQSFLRETQMFTSIAAFFISLAALIVATRNYRRKSGVMVRGYFGFAWSKSCNDRYVTHVVIENLKDRAITIFAIYVKVGHNYYIHIEDHEDKPLILPPYSTYRKDFGPIEFYGFNGRKIDLNNVIKNDQAKQQLVLSTSDGKFVVPRTMSRWNPIRDYFDNDMTIVVRPIQSTYKDRHLGSNVKFVAECAREGGDPEIIPIHAQDYEVSVFRNFKLTKESLESKTALNEFLQSKLENGQLSCKQVIVHDVDEWRERSQEFYKERPITMKYYNAFQYFILGRLGTMLRDWKLKLKNKQLAKQISQPGK